MGLAARSATSAGSRRGAGPHRGALRPPAAPRRSARLAAAAAAGDAAGGERVYSLADQPARQARAVAENNARTLDVDSFYEPEKWSGVRALVKELVECGADVVVTCRTGTDELRELGVTVVEGIDVTDDAACARLGEEVGEPVDVVINNAGYFYEPVETIDNLNFDEELKMIDICAIGPLRVTAALHNAGKIKAPGGKVAMITSQGGSIAWRTTQNPTGGDYGHHMSKAAANMMGVLLAQELKGAGVAVGILHPGFNKTDMTAKYAEIWEVEGAVDPSVGAKRTLHEISNLSMDTTGTFVNCEDGLLIPW